MSPDQLDALASRIEHSDSLPRSLAARRSNNPAAPANTAVIPIIGPLVKRGSFLSEMLGLASYSGIRAQLAQAVSDSSIGKIILFVDSAGGSAQGCDQCASDIVAAARRKPVIAYCEFAASAALWLIAGSTEIIASSDASLGSVGVWSLHWDYSGALARESITPTFIVSAISPFKVEGNEFEPLGKTALAYEQSQIDKIAGNFVAAVARGRGVSQQHVIDRFGKGRVMFADDAKRVGMVDRFGDLSSAFRSTAAVNDRSAVSRRAQLTEFAKLRPPHAPAIARRRRLEELR